MKNNKVAITKYSQPKAKKDEEDVKNKQCRDTKIEMQQPIYKQWRTATYEIPWNGQQKAVTTKQLHFT